MNPNKVWNPFSFRLAIFSTSFGTPTSGHVFCPLPGNSVGSWQRTGFPPDRWNSFYLCSRISRDLKDRPNIKKWQNWKQSFESTVTADPLPNLATTKLWPGECSLSATATVLAGFSPAHQYFLSNGLLFQLHSRPTHPLCVRLPRPAPHPQNHLCLRRQICLPTKICRPGDHDHDHNNPANHVHTTDNDNSTDKAEFAWRLERAFNGVLGSWQRGCWSASQTSWAETKTNLGGGAGPGDPHRPRRGGRGWGGKFCEGKQTVHCSRGLDWESGKNIF